jgi:DNA-directed RNA polymerase alpha subunit
MFRVLCRTVLIRFSMQFVVAKKRRSVGGSSSFVVRKAILLDADFSPVERVNLQVERNVGGHERLVLEVWTDGGVAPVTAVARRRGSSRTTSS